MRGGFLALAVMLVLGACAPGQGPGQVEAGPAPLADAPVALVPADPDTAAAPGPVAPPVDESPRAVQAGPDTAQEPLAMSPFLAEQDRACTRDGGRFVPRGDSGLHACLRTTPDAGRRCTRSTDCVGSCLARSRTCAPFTPLYGCQEVLMDNGARATQCLE